MLSGQGATNGIFFVRLKHWDEREGKENHIKLRHCGHQQAHGKCQVCQYDGFAQPMLSGYGNSNGIEMYVQDRKGEP